MTISGNSIQSGSALTARLVVIGAGPAGIVSALEASRRGVDVILVETGGRKQDPDNQALSAAEREHPDRHAPVDMAVSRQLGGTSAIWGGRCVPYDPVDFEDRDIAPGSSWPIAFADIVPFFERACAWMLCGRPVFDVQDLHHLPAQMVPGLADDYVTTSSLERWSLPTNFGRIYHEELENSPNVRVLTDTTCVRIDLHDDRPLGRSLLCRTLEGRSFRVDADDIIVAAGGLESTRLLMSSPGLEGKSIGDHSDHLGHWYMAHLEGVIADLVLSTPADQTIYWYEQDVDGSYVRRRFGFTANHQLEYGLPNISGWIANPELADAGHRNAQLSLTYLALISPLGFMLAPKAQRLSLTGTKIPGAPYGMATKSPVRSHLANIVRHPLEILRFVFDFGIKRVFSRGRKPPGFFVKNSANRYPLQYHAEHLPNYDSKVTLSGDVDRLGMRKLNIDIRFTEQDVQGVIDAHRHWDKYLQDSGVGRLEFMSPDLAAAVIERTGGGFHQVGTTRMSRDAGAGVVDENLAVHGIPNIHVASSSVFTTSGQANSTFMIVVFAIRLIDHIFGAVHPHA